MDTSHAVHRPRRHRSLTIVSAIATLLATSSVVSPVRADPAPARVERRMIASTVLGKSVPVDVTLPAGYSPDGPPHSVLYLLHGGLGESGPLERFPGAVAAVGDLLSAYGIIGVEPQAGAPWVDPKTEPSREIGGHVEDPNLHTSTPPVSAAVALQPYETHVVTEVIPFIEANYGVVRSRQGRGVLGHSAGGFGSFALALRHPDLFSFVASSSGPLSFRHSSCIEVCGVAAAELGIRDSVTDEIWWRGMDPKELAVNFLSVPMTIAHSAGCPNPLTPHGDPGCGLEGFVNQSNEDFEARLTELGVPHSYFVSETRTHEVIENAVPIYRGRFIPMAAATFAQPPADPATWSYITINRSFSLWGWSFDVRRANTEFLTLRDVGEGGFVARGTGTVAITTPPSYGPQQLYRVSVSGPSSTVTYAVRPDSAGRLAFTITLGPPRVVDQHSTLEGAGQFPFEDYRVSIASDSSATSDDAPECPDVWVYPVVPC